MTAPNRGPRRRTVTVPDEIAVERFIAGDRTIILAVVDRDAAIDYLDSHKLSAAQIAKRLDICSRTVVRRRTMRREGQ